MTTNDELRARVRELEAQLGAAIAGQRKLETTLRRVRPRRVVCYPDLGDIWSPLDAAEQARIIDESLAVTRERWLDRRRKLPPSHEDEQHTRHHTAE